jgi:hypothetical protein
MPGGNQLSSIQHIVVLMLENRSFDHMLGFLYADEGNKAPGGQPFEGLTGKESNPATGGKSVPVFKIKPTDKNAYFMPGADPGEGALRQRQCSDAAGRHQQRVRQGLRLYLEVGGAGEMANPAWDCSAKHYGHLHA